MRKVLVVIFTGIFVAMLIVTTWASSYENVISATKRLVAEPWMVATLFDAYFGFFTFFLWVNYKEANTMKKTVWFFAIMLLGNFAMATYVLLEIRRLRDRFSPQSFLAEQKPA